MKEKINIEKTRNKYHGNYYSFEIETLKRISDADYKTIITSFDNVAKILDPIIDKEIEDKKAKAKTKAKAEK